MWDRNLPAGYGYYHKTVAGAVADGDDKMSLLAVTSGTVTMPNLSGSHNTFGVWILNASAGQVDVAYSTTDGSGAILSLTSSDQAAAVLYFSSSIWHGALLG